MADEGITCGVRRESMATNPLLDRPKLGKTKKLIFAPNDPDRVFGKPSGMNREGSDQAIMSWQDHKPRPAAVPGPDFVAMNKLAAMSHVTDAATLQSFRNDNVIKQRVVEGTLPSRPPLPSDFDPTFRYGLHSKHRTAEVARYNGPIEPPIKHLIQGAYTHEFVHMNARRGMTSTNAADYVRKPIKPATTRAAEGHKYGATKKYLLPEIAASTSPGGGDDGMWKMTKFKKVGPVVTQYMGGVTSPGGSAAPIEAS